MNSKSSGLDRESRSALLNYALGVGAKSIVSGTEEQGRNVGRIESHAGPLDPALLIT